MSPTANEALSRGSDPGNGNSGREAGTLTTEDAGNHNDGMQARLAVFHQAMTESLGTTALHLTKDFLGSELQIARSEKEGETIRAQEAERLRD